MKSSLQRWEKLETKPLFSARIFDLLVSKVKHPITGHIGDYYTINATDWVNIIPVTPRGEIVMVKQYRHGIEDFSLELPGGMLDNSQEDPSIAAQRELVEETGYRVDTISYLGKVSPNPAVQNNYSHFFLGTNAQLVSAQSLDPGEDIEILVLPFNEVIDLVLNGQVKHALILCAFLKLFLAQLDPQIVKGIKLTN